MYLYAVAFFSAHAELNVFQYLVGNPNEVRLLSVALDLRFLDRGRRNLVPTISGENHGG